MGRQDSDSNLADDIDEFFEPAIGDNFEETYEAVTSSNAKQQRIANMRRRAEQRMEQKRLREELDYFDLDWDD